MGSAVRQITFGSQASFEKYGRKSKREQFLETMEGVVPWTELVALIEPYYPKAGNGRQPVGLSIMLRVYFLQQWFNLSDPGAEDALYESPALRRFAGVDLGRAAAPDETYTVNVRAENTVTRTAKGTPVNVTPVLRLVGSAIVNV